MLISASAAPNHGNTKKEPYKQDEYWNRQTAREEWGGGGGGRGGGGGEKQPEDIWFSPN